MICKLQNFSARKKFHSMNRLVPEDYCNSRLWCACVHDAEEVFLDERKCDADEECKGTMGSKGSCHTEHGNIVTFIIIKM